MGFSSTVQQDLRTITEGAGLVVAPEGMLAMPTGIIIGERQHSGGGDIDITYEYTPELAALISETTAGLLGITTAAVEGIFAAQETASEQAASASEQAAAVTEQAMLGEETSAFVKYLPYVIIAFLAFIYLIRK